MAIAWLINLFDALAWSRRSWFSLPLCSCRCPSCRVTVVPFRDSWGNTCCRSSWHRTVSLTPVKLREKWSYQVQVQCCMILSQLVIFSLTESTLTDVPLFWWWPYLVHKLDRKPSRSTYTGYIIISTFN